MRRSGSGRRGGSEGELGWDVRSGGASRKGRREGASKCPCFLSPGFSFYPRLLFILLV
jgi:hypothetical protein